MLAIARRPLALTLPLLFWGCAEVVTPPTISRVTFDKHTATLWSGDLLATSVSVVKTNGEIVLNPQVTYTSSDSRVATVDATGTVYAHHAGQATISAAVGSITDELTVTVVWPPVTALVFNDDSLVAFVGDTVTTTVIVLNARGNVATNATLTFSSSAPSIARMVEQLYCCYGRVAVIGEGRATITVTAEGLRDSLQLVVTPR